VNLRIAYGLIERTSEKGRKGYMRKKKKERDRKKQVARKR